MARRKKLITPGDVFAIPLCDGSYSFGQVLALEPECFGAAAMVLFTARNTSSEEPKVLYDRFAVQLVDTIPLERGEWPIVGRCDLVMANPFEAGRRTGFVGYTMIGSANIRKFCEAYHGLRAWDDWFDPEYLDKLLISADLKPPGVKYKADIE